MSVVIPKTIKFLFVYTCIAVGDPVIKKERVGASLVCLTLPHALACPKPESGFLTSSVVFFLCPVSSVKMKGHCFALFDIG